MISDVTWANKVRSENQLSTHLATFQEHRTPLRGYRELFAHIGLPSIPPQHLLMTNRIWFLSAAIVLLVIQCLKVYPISSSKCWLQLRFRKQELITRCIGEFRATVLPRRCIQLHNSRAKLCFFGALLLGYMITDKSEITSFDTGICVSGQGYARLSLIYSLCNEPESAEAVVRASASLKQTWLSSLFTERVTTGPEGYRTFSLLLHSTWQFCKRVLCRDIFHC